LVKVEFRDKGDNVADFGADNRLASTDEPVPDFGLESEAAPPVSPLYAWVNSNPPPTATRFSLRRAAKLFAVVVFASLIASLPVFLIKMGVILGSRARDEQLRKQKLADDWVATNKAIQEAKGMSGEAARRLFGIDAPRPVRPPGAVLPPEP
jgi:hypothetical protein